MKLFKINDDGTLYWVVATSAEEAAQHLDNEHLHEWGTEPEVPLEEWIVEECENSITVNYDEVDDEGNIISATSEEFIQESIKMGECQIIACSEWD